MLLVVGLGLGVAACASEPAAEDDEPGDIAEEDVGAGDVGTARVDPLLMPRVIVDFLNQQGWGRHHLEWHTTRRWDLLAEADIEWAQRQGWRRATLQEGTPGNGLEFLAMHRVMLRTLSKKAPRYASLFAGWKQVPTDPRDRADPLPGGDDSGFDVEMQKALARLETQLDGIKSDDELGLFLETTLRPSRTNPRARAKDKRAGLHNYLHNRFTDAGSKIDIGDPSVNLANKRFWRLHGWIDAVWTRWRALKGLGDDAPAYARALALAEAEMSAHGGVRSPRPEPIPETLRHIFALE